MNARERLSRMVRTDRWSNTVWSPSEVSDALDAYKAEVLRKEAGDVVLFCPDHSNHYASYLSCHCPVADVLRQRANKAAAPTVPVPDNTAADEGELARLREELAQMRAARDVIASLHRDLNARLSAVLDMCDREQRNAMRWQDPIPVPEWVAPVQRAALGDDVRQAAKPEVQS